MDRYETLLRFARELLDQPADQPATEPGGGSQPDGGQPDDGGGT
jgi:hypothetical protein